MAKYRTAQGKVVDMSVLMAQNERTRAVGNMKVNARGDTIDDQGRIITPVTQKVGEKYQKSVGNRSAQAKKSAAPAPVKAPVKAPVNTPVNTPVNDPVVEEELTQEEKELDASFDDEEIEQIKAQETKKK